MANARQQVTQKHISITINHRNNKYVDMYKRNNGTDHRINNKKTY